MLGADEEETGAPPNEGDFDAAALNPERSLTIHSVPADASAAMSRSGVGAAHANMVLKFVLVPVGVVCSGVSDEEARRRESQQGMRAV